MFDYLRIALWVGSVATIVALVCLGVLVYANRASTPMVLSAATLVGAIIAGVVIPMYFLQPRESSNSGFKTEFTTDNEYSKILQFRYPSGYIHRKVDEVEANKFLLAINSSAFQHDGEKLWRDMSLFSLILYLWADQHDWQMPRDILRDSRGTYERFQYLSNSNQANGCKKIELATIQTMLRETGNVFADYEPMAVPWKFMCLPPQSSIYIKSAAVTIETPFCEIHFVVDPSWIIKTSTKPGTNEMPLIGNPPRPRFETRTGIIRAEIKYSWIRAQSPEMQKYQAWANDVVERAKKWFTTEIPQGSNFFESEFE